MKFVNEKVTLMVNDTINKEFINMNISDKKIVVKYTCIVLNAIAIFFNFDVDTSKNNIYYNEITQNKCEIIKWLLKYILPYINEKIEKKSEIYSINDIYTKKSKDSNTDLKLSDPRYVFSNLQYNRCNRESFTEIQFNEEYIRDNCYLFIDSLKYSYCKLFPNWIDLIPYDMINYKNTPLYQDTYDLITHKNLTDWNTMDFFNNSTDLVNNNYKGLYVGIMYDTISHLLYNDAAESKWLMYELILELGSFCYEYRRIPLLLYLSQYIDIDTLYKKDELNNLDNNNFKLGCENIIRVLSYSDNVNIQNFITSKEEHNILIKSIVIYFESQYRNIHKLKENGFAGLQEKYKNFVYDEETNASKVQMSDVLEIYTKIITDHLNDLYMFLSDEIKKFSKTWYGNKFFTSANKFIEVSNNSDSIAKLYLDKINIQINNGNSSPYIYITIKNIYNFFKSMIHVDKSRKIINKKNNNEENKVKYEKIQEYWCTCNDDQKNIFLNRINNKNQDWFNITGNIKKHIYGSDLNVDSIELNRVNAAMYNIIKNIFLQTIFETLIINGELVYLNPNPSISNKEITTRLSETNKFPNLETNNQNIYWNHSYHFITCRPYSNTGNFEYENKLTNVFQFMQDTRWNCRISLHWMAQIGITNKILNQRVHFVSGGTGIGKSSTVPMLYMYFLKSLLYTNGSVVCTQPRIKPTADSAAFISLQLGLPILNYNYDKNADKIISNNNSNFFTKNYTVQMQHGEKNGSHSDNGNYLKLNITTDGSLTFKLISPIGLVPYTKNETVDYRNKLLNNVIIVDEAHEHNTNMDVILSLMNTININNNKTILVIMSATLDDDESTYRRYYRDINDNKKFPLHWGISNYKIDRINVDRRLDISEPGMDTQHPIEDIYLPEKAGKKPGKPGNNDEINKFVANIMRTTSSGYGLLFQPGVGEIKESVEYINQNTPPNIIALPYHSKLGKNLEFISNIDNTLKNIKISKNNDLFDPDIDLTKGNAKYDRCILVATNIAEASITIKNLKFVFDTGLQRINEYNYKLKDSATRLTEISESSRIQRRGRVGRASSGTVYYFYKKDQMKFNTKKYNISIEDISETILMLMRKNKNEHIAIPFKLNKQFTYDDVEKINSFGIQTFIKKSYYIDDATNGQIYNYIGNLAHYDYNYDNPQIFYYENGYSFKDVIDKYGRFYIIHPEELNIKRNIIGNIVSTNNNTSDVQIKQGDKGEGGYIISHKMASFADRLLKQLYITIDQNNVIKTEIGKYISDMYKSFTNYKLDFIFTFNDIKLLIYGICFDSLDEISTYIAIKKCGLNVEDLLFKSEKSDILSLINLGQKISELNQINKSASEISNILSVSQNNVYKYLTNKNNISQCINESNKDNDTKKIKNDYDKLNYFKTYLLPLSKIKIPKNKEEMISIILLLTNSNSLMKFVDKKYYIHVIYPIFSLGSLIGKTSVNYKYLYNYIIYDEYDAKKNVMSLIHYIDPKLLGYISNMYSLTNFTKFKENYNKDNIDADYQIFNNYGKTYDKIFYDLKETNIKNMWGIYRQIDPKYQYIEKIYEDAYNKYHVNIDNIFDSEI